MAQYTPVGAEYLRVKATPEYSVGKRDGKSIGIVIGLAVNAVASVTLLALQRHEVNVLTERHRQELREHGIPVGQPPDLPAP